MSKIIYILITISFIPLNAQLIRNDDFQFKDNYWYWRTDGNQSIPTVESGLLHLNLINAVNSEYCNTEIYDRSEPYQPGTQAKMRIKASPQHIGSRGWGFWDGDVLLDYDVAWIMEQSSTNPAPDYNWFLFGVDGDLLQNKQALDLTNIVDETQWHTYKIIWRSDSTFLLIDDTQIFVSTSHLPDENMRIDLWIDNRVINISNPFEFWNNNSIGSEMFVDYIEISGTNGPSISRSHSGSILIWDSPNTFGSGANKVLWKNYEFNTSGNGEGLVIITGDAETYNGVSDDDDLKIVIDNFDYGWNNSNSLNGDVLNGSGASLVIPISPIDGQHFLEIHSDVTPFLRDVIVLYSENGGIILNNTYNETASSSNGLWKTINFNSQGQDKTIFLISGSGFNGDKIRVEIDDTDYSWIGENAIDGDELLGTPKTIVIVETLPGGNHTLRIYKQGNPKLYNIAVYSNNIAKFEIKVYLEGAYNNLNGMVSNLNQNEEFPLNQPYNRFPWNYSGNEKLTTVPENIIDWVLVELRDSHISPSKKYLRAGLLRNDGAVIDLNGDMLKFSGIELGNYYVAIYHRNHLPILSSGTIEFQ